MHVEFLILKSQGTLSGLVIFKSNFSQIIYMYMQENKMRTTRSISYKETCPLYLYSKV